MLEVVAHLICMLHSSPDSREPTMSTCSKVMRLTPPLPSNKVHTTAAPQSSCNSTSLPALSNLQHYPEGGLHSSSGVHARMAAKVLACPGQWVHRAIQARPHCMPLPHHHELPLLDENPPQPP